MTITPEFFDIFGIFVFAFITIVAYMGLKNKNRLPYWILITLLTIGIFGLVVDAVNVYMAYFR